MEIAGNLVEIVPDAGDLHRQILNLSQIGNDIIVDFQLFAESLFAYKSTNRVSSIFSISGYPLILQFCETDVNSFPPMKRFLFLWSSHSIILLHFIVAEQLPISRRRSAANTFMWSRIAKIQDFVRTVGMGNGIPIKIASREKPRK